MRETERCVYPVPGSGGRGVGCHGNTEQGGLRDSSKQISWSSLNRVLKGSGNYTGKGSREEVMF